MTAFKFIRPTTITDSGGSFARSTTATYFDSAGVMQTAAIDVPRIGYNPVTHAYTGLILEGAGTNLLLRSAEFDNAAWVKDTTTITANSIAAPDGTVSADTQTTSGSGGPNTGWTQSAIITVSTSTTYTASRYVKQGNTATSIYSLARVSPYSAIFATITWGATPSVVGSGADLLGSSITAAGNGWWRVSLTMSSATATQMAERLYTRDLSTSVQSGDTVYTWGAQLEAGSTATSYIPTTSAAVTRAADVVTGSGLIYTDVPENDYPAWVGGTTYTALTSYVIRTTATTHKVYQCLVTHTAAATPEDNTTGVTPKWLEIGPTNRWGMFDRKVGTTTTKATSMTYLLKPGRANSLGLLGIDADSVEVSLVANDEIVYAASIDLNSGNTVGDWYQYFYEPIYSTDAVAITNLLDATLMDLPAYGDGVLCVRFLSTAGSVTCGVMAVGLYAELGTTLYDPTIGIIDYSRKSVDAFGNYDITERTYSKRMSATLMVESTDVDNTARLLTQYRATPVVWVGADNLYSSLIVYGFAKDWEETIKGPTHSTCSIQVEGLT